MVSIYNSASKPLHNLLNIVLRDITLHGFGIFRLAHKYEEQFYKEMPTRVASGEIKYCEDITRGLRHAGHALAAVQYGKNKGKSIVIVADE